MEETKIESKDLGQDGFKVIHYKTIDSTQKRNMEKSEKWHNRK